MSGIAGIYHCGTIKPVDPTRVERMCDALLHRGPDAAAVWTASGVGLGCRRLKIGQRAGSAQPISSAEDRAVLVYDGEIYNSHELRRELGTLGAEFCTADDGDVILAAWQRWGADCLRRLHGMFAFAIYDATARTLFLARDRFGEKPLFTAHLSDGSVAFASELKGLLAHPLLRREVDPLAIEDYLAWGFVPDERSIMKGVEKLAAGHYRLLRHGAHPGPAHRWWDISFAERRRGSVRDLEAELLHHLREAVTSRMVADVPSGAFLCGDVNSSTVVAFMAEASRMPVKTCTIDFAAAPTDASSAATTVAKLFGTDHAMRQPGSEEFAAIDTLVAMFDEPFADPSALPSWRLSQLARERMTVALSGDGADEALAGYPRHVLHSHAERVRSAMPAGFRRVLGRLGEVYPEADWAPRPLRAKAALLALARNGTEGFARSASVLSAELRTSLYAPDLARELGDYRAEMGMISQMKAAPARSALDRAQYADLTFSLPGATLTRADRTSMAVSLELREPLLDHRLVEFTATLPERMRVRGMQGKWLLKKAMRRYLPDDILHRREHSAVVPISQWLRGPLAGETKAIAASAALARTGWLDTARLLRLAEAHCGGRADQSRLLWQILILDRSLVRLGVIA